MITTITQARTLQDAYMEQKLYDPGPNWKTDL